MNLGLAVAHGCGGAAKHHLGYGRWSIGAAPQRLGVTVPDHAYNRHAGLTAVRRRPDLDSARRRRRERWPDTDRMLPANRPHSRRFRTKPDRFRPVDRSAIVR